MKRLSLTRSLVAVVVSFGLVLAGSGTANAKPKPATAAKTGYTQVVVDPAVYQLIGSASITPAPIGGAKAFAYKGTLAARFPITGYALTGLRIKHSGGLSLTAGSSTISLSNFNIDLARLAVSGEVAGTIGNAGRVDLFQITWSPRLDLGLVRLTLTAAAADALNKTFGVDAVKAGDTFGYATPTPFAAF